MTMTSIDERQQTGLAIPLHPDTPLDGAILLAEDDAGYAQPISIASSINEARELAESDLRQRLQKLDRGQEAGICPVRYTLWARGIDGQYTLVLSFLN